MKGIAQAFRDGWKSFNFGGVGGGGSYGYSDPFMTGFRRLPGAAFDYRTEAGNLWENSVVAACIEWATSVFSEAPLVVQFRKQDEWETIEGHAFCDLMNSPNPDYDASVLNSGLIIGRMCAGNAYWYIEKDGLRYPKRLYYMPHYAVAPQWPPSGNTFISSYCYKALGGSNPIFYPPEDVFHSRVGVDPLNVRLGLSPLNALLREICTDNEASTAAAALMRNQGVLGIAFTPDAEIDGTDEAQLQKFRQLGQQKFTGEHRGEFFATSMPGKFENIGFSPDKLALDVLRRLPEERITGALRIPAVVVGMGAGLERSTFSNFQEARRAAYESFMVPLWKNVARELSLQFLPMYGQSGDDYRIWFDYSDVEGLQENADELHNRVREDFKQQMITRAEARTELELDVEEARDDIFFTPDIARITETGKEPPSEDEDIAKQAKGLRDRVLRRWRK